MAIYVDLGASVEKAYNNVTRPGRVPSHAYYVRWYQIGFRSLTVCDSTNCSERLDATMGIGELVLLADVKLGFGAHTPR